MFLLPMNSKALYLRLPRASHRVSKKKNKTFFSHHIKQVCSILTLAIKHGNIFNLIRLFFKQGVHIPYTVYHTSRGVLW